MADLATERSQKAEVGTGGSGESSVPPLSSVILTGWPKLKLKFKLNSMKTMTMLEFRKDARKALAAIQRGERLLLTYRGRAVAQLSPAREARQVLPDHDALRRLSAFSVDGSGTRLSNDDIDRTVYGS